MATMAPQWLLPAYSRSVVALGATSSAERIEECGRDLIARWSSPDRHFHDIAHLVAVLERVDELAEETHDPDLVRVAAWYHGAIFDSKVHAMYNRAVGENKDASAAHADYELRQLGVPAEKAARVAELIRGLTRHDSDPQDVDSMVLCDADLGILATEPQKYRDYRVRVRSEFSHVDPLRYLEARIAIVSKLLARRRLFMSPQASRWEDAARQNLTAELVRLSKERDAIITQEPGAGASQEPLPAATELSAPPEARTPSASAPSTATPETAREEEEAEAAEARDQVAEVVGVPFEERPRVPLSTPPEDIESTGSLFRPLEDL